MTSRTQGTCRALGRALILTRCWEMRMSRQTMVSSEDCMRPMDAARYRVHTCVIYILRIMLMYMYAPAMSSSRDR